MGKTLCIHVINPTGTPHFYRYGYLCPAMLTLTACSCHLSIHPLSCPSIHINHPLVQGRHAPCLLFIFGLRTCLTFSSLTSAHMLNLSICLTPSTLQCPCKRAFILPLMTCHSFHLAQSLIAPSHVHPCTAWPNPHSTCCWHYPSHRYPPPYISLGE